MKTFIQFLESKQSEEEVFHHVTNVPFEGKFKAFSHFGTEKAALARGARINQDNPDVTSFDHYKVRINKGKTVEIPDPIVHKPHNIAKSVYQEGHIDKNQFKKLHTEMSSVDSDDEKHKILANFLRDNGIHTVSYRNKVEHPGSMSYMITHPKQVEVIDKKENAKLDLAKGRENLLKI